MQLFKKTKKISEQKKIGQLKKFFRSQLFFLGGGFLRISDFEKIGAVF